jgi:3-hydroxy acid dehydrogenase / malonic semialdehyde reductase
LKVHGEYSYHMGREVPNGLAGCPLGLATCCFPPDLSKEHAEMLSPRGKTVFVTGASSGIGEACAKAFAGVGARLLLGARRIDRLNTLAQTLRKEHQAEVYSVQMDVTRYKELEAAISGLPKEWKEVDVLVNNAGLALKTDKLFDAAAGDWDTMIDTNVKGLLYVTRLILPGMVERKRGHVINIASIGGFELYPGGSVYCATKAAVQTLSKVLRMDVLGHSIRVTNIDPGITRSEFNLVRWKGNREKAEKVYEGLKCLSAQDIAEAVLFCATRPPHVNIGELVITPTDQINVFLVHKEKNS